MEVRFIIPLQSPMASDSWSRVSQLCIRTIGSVTSQTNPNFRVLLVCNEPPENYQSHTRVEVLLANLPPPGKGQQRMEDKWKKISLGLSHYRDEPDAYYMIVDADDRVSNRIVDFVLKEDYRPGWYFEKGFIYDWGFPWLYLRKRFHLFCGTSSVLFCPSSMLPGNPDSTSDTCYLIKYGHTAIKSYFDTQEKPLKPAPFCGAIYMLNTGENHTRESYLGVKSRLEKVKRFFSIRGITRGIKREFSLWDI